jgi:hypothetical protein
LSFPKSAIPSIDSLAAGAAGLDGRMRCVKAAAGAPVWV